ncbi:MAG: (E)-4-hydroxy-3-methylbut-2-enyl-diphosphate synthase [Parachlamydiaceae bacterium]|nr:(E)-4-hydroxy-3-methylbut-2-enyl-diphosphate synthase [Parachlamydiaceae bacterium]
MIKYCESIYKTIRRKTREVMVGNVGVGGNNPVRIQSMTTSNTRDIEATIDQIARLADAGCEIARITVQGMKEADACEGIKNGLIKRGYTIPLVADIHFFPPAALRVIDFVDKVRVNPGNFVDKRASFKTIDYNDSSYALETEKIEEKFTPLVEKCKRLKRAMRIGTNHGSLSDRIMNRYGDTPRGMLESALEFARVCRNNGYHDFMFSMKSSNPLVMIQAYRLLAAEMITLGWDYPLHLGVTEAGQGEDGRIKSAMGIGTLLLDGIGDTIRVSLTEDAWHEIDPCQRLIAIASQYERSEGTHPFRETFRQIDSIQKRQVTFPKHISLHRDGTVFLGVSNEDILSPDFFKKLGCDVQMGRPKLKSSSADSIVLLEKHTTDYTPVLKKLHEIGVSSFCQNSNPCDVEILSLSDAISAHEIKAKASRFMLMPTGAIPYAIIISDETPQLWTMLKELQPSLIILAPENNRLHYCRNFFEWLQTEKIQTPVILNFSYTCSKEDLIIQSSAEFGALLCDGLGNGIWLEGPYEIDLLRNLSFNILQAARMRTFKTDFISCPSCGRTLFDLQDVSQRIRERTSHLPGVKIAIMGCIVNGPGEMADADFGYVGSKPGMIDLYVGKGCIEKDISFADAVERLVELIKKHGRWVEPEAEEDTNQDALAAVASDQLA